MGLGIGYKTQETGNCVVKLVIKFKGSIKLGKKSRRHYKCRRKEVRKLVLIGDDLRFMAYKEILNIYF